jgi:cytochrome P450
MVPYSHENVATLFKPLDPEFIRNPFPVFQALRKWAPVFWDETLHSWVATRYADCQRILSDSAVFAADYRRLGIETPPGNLSIQSTDPPQHEELRHPLTAALRGIPNAELETLAAAKATAILSSLRYDAPIDLVGDFQVPLALAVASRLIGVDSETNPYVMEQSDRVVRSMVSGLRPETARPGIDARAALTQIIRSWITIARPDSILGSVRETVGRGSRDIPEPLINSVRAIFLAAINSTQRFLGNAILSLLAEPGARETIVSFPRRGRLMTLALQELIRLNTPFHAQEKICVQNVQLGGQSLRRGDLVVALVGSANRDPDQFDDAETMHLDRNPNPHLGFGCGPHSCLGAAVALMEARIAIRALFTMYPNLQLAGEPIYSPNAALRGLALLPVLLGQPSSSLFAS